jgi:hypothetical protein
MKLQVCCLLTLVISVASCKPPVQRATGPPGDWTAIKIFLGQGDKEAELFLNINPTIRKGEFSMQDHDYGDLAISRLATVL